MAGRIGDSSDKRPAAKEAAHEKGAKERPTPAPAPGRRYEADGRPRAQALVVIEVRGELAPVLALEQVPDRGPPALRRLVTAIAGSARVRRIGVVSQAAYALPGLRAVCEEAQVTYIEGRAPDALAAFVQALRQLDAGPDQIVLRVASSSVLLGPEVIDSAVETLLEGGYDFVSTDLGSGVLPVGLDVEATYARLLYELDSTAEHGADRDLVTAPLCRSQNTRSTKRRVHELSPTELGPALERSGRYYASFRLGLEQREDLSLLRRVATLLERQQEPLGLHTLLRLLDQHPEWRYAEHHVLRARR